MSVNYYQTTGLNIPEDDMNCINVKVMAWNERM
jgi:hypothetical protein